MPKSASPTTRAAQRAADRLQQQHATSRWTLPALRRTVTRLRTDPVTPEPPASRSYPFPPRAARWIKTRDVTCVFPACPRLARYCHNDHLVAWPRGATEISNGASECVHHHQAKHGPLTATRLPDGTIRWTNRHGTSIDRRPRALLRGW